MGEVGWGALLARVEGLVERLERLVPPGVPAGPDWDNHIAFRWRREGHRGWVQPVRRLQTIGLDDLRAVDAQKAALERNTRQFVAGLPANNALLSGARGTGKSSLVKALLNAYSHQGLRLLEVDPHELVDLPDIVAGLEGRAERFILFSDDLSFEAGDPSFKALKAMLDGSVEGVPQNVLVYATSNRRHLMPEYLHENLETHVVDGEVHPSEGVEERLSLSERFGLWLSFYPFGQDAYLEIAAAWVTRLGGATQHAAGLREEALRWALARGSRSGRVAYQFARYWVGSRGLA